MNKKKNYYRTPEGYLLNPFDSLYIPSDDIEISSEPAIRELWDYAHDLSEKISGDFDMDYVKFEFRYNSLSFIRNGLLAFKIKSFQLYKKTHSNFKTYCKDVLAQSYSKVRRLINAARIAIELIHAGFDVIPENPSQCSHLEKFSGNELIQKWEDILNNLKDNITAEKIKNFLDPPTAAEELNTTVKLPVKLYDVLLRSALDSGTSIITVIADMCYEKFQTDNSTNETSDKKLNAWREDLKDLTSNHKGLDEEQSTA
ncbi:MAG: hypothetical protein ACFBSE_10625 [Prochloraceae cyanobacterium]